MKIFKKFECEKGLTLIELLTVVSIILILSAVVFGNYRIGNNAQALDRAAQKLAQDFRRVNELSISGKGLSSSLNAYGIYFDRTTAASSKTYIVYKNAVNGTVYTYNTGAPADTIDQTINIEKGVKICDILGNGTGGINTISVAFVPPEPVVYMDANYANYETTIKLGIESDNCAATAKFKYVKINNVGRVDVANQ